MKGVVTRIFPNNGYGFVRDDDGFLRFFHANDFKPIRAFDTLREGQGLEFDPLDLGESPTGKDNGLRAVNIHVL
jgi:cold shock CspA family protein